MALYYGLAWDFMGVNGKKWIIYDKLGLFVDNFLLEFIKIMNFFVRWLISRVLYPQSGDDHSSWIYVTINL